MEKLTLSDVNRFTGAAVMNIIIILSFTVYKLFQGINTEYLIILAACLLGMFSVYRVASLFRDALSSMGGLSVSRFDSLFTSFCLMIILGGLSIYVFFVKGIYGLYLLTEDFSWYLLGLRLLIVVVGYRLVKSIDKIQGVFKAIESQKYNIKDH